MEGRHASSSSTITISLCFLVGALATDNEIQTRSQDSFVESYLTNQRSHVFTSVAVLIFVFDIASREAAPDMLSFANTIRALQEFSPNSKIFVLIHKMDLISGDHRGTLYAQKASDIRATCEDEGFTGKQVDICPSSIWDQSLYRAWTQVIYFLVPNATVIEEMLGKLAELLDAREMILYERTTCLVVTHITRGSEAQNPYTDRFERISSILKTHKHSMSKHTGMMPSEVSFAEMQIKTGTFMFFITRLTENTNLAVVMPSDEASYNAARVNVQLARREFAHLDIVEKKGKEVQSHNSSSNTSGSGSSSSRTNHAATYRETAATRDEERDDGSEDSEPMSSSRIMHDGR